MISIAVFLGLFLLVEIVWREKRQKERVRRQTALTQWESCADEFKVWMSQHPNKNHRTYEKFLEFKRRLGDCARTYVQYGGIWANVDFDKLRGYEGCWSHTPQADRFKNFLNPVPI